MASALRCTGHLGTASVLGRSMFSGPGRRPGLGLGVARSRRHQHEAGARVVLVVEKARRLVKICGRSRWEERMHNGEVEGEELCWLGLSYPCPA